MFTYSKLNLFPDRKRVDCLVRV